MPKRARGGAPRVRGRKPACALLAASRKRTAAMPSGMAALPRTTRCPWRAACMAALLQPSANPSACGALHPGLPGAGPRFNPRDDLPAGYPALMTSETRSRYSRDSSVATRLGSTCYRHHQQSPPKAGTGFRWQEISIFRCDWWLLFKRALGGVKQMEAARDVPGHSPQAHPCIEFCAMQPDLL